MTNGSAKSRQRCLSGMRPTGKLHLGNYVGALQNWVKLQYTHECFFFVADWHVLTTDYDDTSRLADSTLEVMLDYLAAGLDPEKSTLFVQSHIMQHAELHLLFSMITPLGWLERIPTYKEQQQNLPNKDLHMYGFLGYPLLQAADILIYRPDFVPVGEDQTSHVELTREVARRFNHFYSFKGQPVFPEPQVLLTPAPKLLGTDKRKMSKSYGNAILLSEEPDQVAEKIKNSVTDRPKLTDHGNPSNCPVGNLHQIFSDPKTLAYITEGCTQAKITCVECKELAIGGVNAHLEPLRERRRELAQHPKRLKDIIQQGDEKARKFAEETMVAAREAVGLLELDSLAGTGERALRMALLGAADALAGPMRVPDSVLDADFQERWQIRTSIWLRRISLGCKLNKTSPWTFVTPGRRRVGVHTASERNGGWHFRVRARHLDVLVLLAQTHDLYLQDYVLPPKVVQAYLKQFEREDSDILINATKVSDNMVLSVGGTDVPIEQYRANYAPLK